MRTTDGLRASLVAALALALAACSGGSAPKPADAAPPPAELRVGDLRIMASVVDTMALPQQVAQQYGIPRGKSTSMLLVSVRRGAEEIAVPARVQARAQTLTGNVIDIPMRETRTASDFVDNIGTFQVAPPDTLKFTVQVSPRDAPAATLEFTRDVAP